MIVLGIILFVIGLGFFYWPNIVVRFLEQVEKVFFNKRFLILQNKKIGLVFILISIIIIFTNIRMITQKNLFYKAYTNFYSHNFVSTEKICLDIVNKQPDNIDAWMLLGKTYFVTGRYLLAKSVFMRIKNMHNISEKNKKEVEKYFVLIDKKLEKQK